MIKVIRNINDMILLMLMITFFKSLTFQFPSNSVFKVIFEFTEAECCSNFIWDFISQSRTNEK